MENEDKSLNTEANDIAGNRINGPVGNTAAKPTRPGMGVGIPGGAPAAAEHDIDSPTASASSESLAASEMCAGEGAVGDNLQHQENCAADPKHLKPTRAASSGFSSSNSIQGSHHDQARHDNQASDANRGEFGAQDLGGTTHGGFGNQNRLADYEPHGSAEDKYYGGPGRPGPQENAYRAYDGRDERPDSRSEYGFERGAAPAPEASRAGGNDQPNDNGAPKGPDSGYAADYGHTSLRADDDTEAHRSPAATSGRRNQSEDYQPAQAGYDNQGRHDEQQHPVARQGERSEGSPSPDLRAGHDRSGYVQAPGGNSDQGLGSRGGSYNDAYDDSRPGSLAGSPAPGDQRREDLNANYGETARRENRPDDSDTDDHGAPRRNAGREGEADE